MIEELEREIKSLWPSFEWRVQRDSCVLGMWGRPKDNRFLLEVEILYVKTASGRFHVPGGVVFIRREGEIGQVLAELKTFTEGMREALGGV